MDTKITCKCVTSIYYTQVSETLLLFPKLDKKYIEFLGGLPTVGALMTQFIFNNARISDAKVFQFHPALNSISYTPLMHETEPLEAHTFLLQSAF